VKKQGLFVVYALDLEDDDWDEWLPQTPALPWSQAIREVERLWGKGLLARPIPQAMGAVA